MAGHTHWRRLAFLYSTLITSHINSKKVCIRISSQKNTEAYFVLSRGRLTPVYPNVSGHLMSAASVFTALVSVHYT